MFRIEFGVNGGHRRSCQEDTGHGPGENRSSGRDSCEASACRGVCRVEEPCSAVGPGVSPEIPSRAPASTGECRDHANACAS